jgi:hypothetical protein
MMECLRSCKEIPSSLTSRPLLPTLHCPPEFLWLTLRLKAKMVEISRVGAKPVFQTSDN